MTTLTERLGPTRTIRAMRAGALGLLLLSVILAALALADLITPTTAFNRVRDGSLWSGVLLALVSRGMQSAHDRKAQSAHDTKQEVPKP